MCNLKKLILNNFFYLIFTSIIILIVPHINIVSYPYSTHTSKFVVFSFLCIVVFSFWVIFLTFQKRITFCFSKIDITLSILVFYIIIASYLIYEGESISLLAFELFALGFFYLLLRNVPIKSFYLFLVIISISGVIQSVIGCMQLMGYFPSNHSKFNLTGSFFNPGPYAGFLATVFPLALGLNIYKQPISEFCVTNMNFKGISLNKVIRFIYQYIPIISLISILIIIPATRSRATWLSVIFSSFFLLELRYNIFRKAFQKFNVFTKIISVSTAIASVGLLFTCLYQLKKGSSNGRLLIWKVSTEIIKDHPFLGVGFDRFKVHYMNYQASYFQKFRESTEALVADNTYYAFNEFILFTVENGILGLSLLIALFYFLVTTKTINEYKTFKRIMLGALLGISIFAFFSYPSQILPIKLILVSILAGLSSISKSKYRFIEIPENSNFRIFGKTLIILCSLSIATFLFLKLKKLDRSYKDWKMATTSYSYGDYETALTEFKRAYPNLKNNGEFLMNYGKTLSINKKDEEALKVLNEAKKYLNTTIIETSLGDVYKNLGKYKKSEASYIHASNMIPSRFYPMYLLAKLYTENCEIDKALDIAKILLNKKIKVPSTAITEMQEEMQKIIKKNSLTNESTTDQQY